MIYYQFVLKVNKQSLPITMQKKYRKESIALKALKTYMNQGLSGCMVTFFVEADNYGMKEVKEF